MKIKKLICVLCCGSVCLILASCGKFSPEDIDFGSDCEVVKSNDDIATVECEEPDEIFKSVNGENNPLLTNIFCADPTSVEYEGRLYVYGTNDNQQYLEKGDSNNTYEKIKSFVIMSTDDMVNWQYEGLINTAEIAPWIYASWAPSICSRVEDDGKTHFYLYFSNSGAGVGVLTATNPAGPWTDPLGAPLIYAGMDGLENCPYPFDPGVVIDDEGNGWLAFGGGVARTGTKYMPGVSRICKLGKDMISVDGEIAEIPAPYFFEASELNYINGTYVYTYNTSWESRVEWDIASAVSAPTACSMSYMTTKTPLDSESWEYKDYYLKNPGELGMEYSNNHTHLQKFNDKYYLFFHTMILQKERGITQGFRSLCSYEAVVDEENVTISRLEATRIGTPQIKMFDPYQINEAENAFLTNCEYVSDDSGIAAKCKDNTVIAVKGCDFGNGSKAFAAKVCGKGTIEIRLDSFDGEKVGAISFDNTEAQAVYTDIKIDGTHDVFFVFSGKFAFDKWSFYSR